MKFDDAYLGGRMLWSSPFVRWQGALADVSSIDLAHAVTRDALARIAFDVERVDNLVLGTTIPQVHSFYGAPWLAARLGMTGVTGPHIAQACATSVSCLVSAATAVDADADTVSLVVTADRTSNGPVLMYPRTAATGGSPVVENWVLDNFAADPWTGQSMAHTAEAVAADGGMTREAVDEVTLMRFAQYQDALADDRAIQRRYFQPIAIDKGRKRVTIDEDDGVHPYTAEGLGSLKSGQPGGVVTFGNQTHPADGAAGAIVTSKRIAASLSNGDGVVKLVSASFARAEKGRMPKAATLAAQKAVAEAGLSFDDVKVVVTHNPFAVNDLWFHRETGFSLEKMNPYGCSLIYGHPQGPTGLRGIVELVEALRVQGGGIGVFTGCAAGDTGASVVLSVE